MTRMYVFLFSLLLIPCVTIAEKSLKDWFIVKGENVDYYQAMNLFNSARARSKLTKMLQKDLDFVIERLLQATSRGMPIAALSLAEITRSFGDHRAQYYLTSIAIGLDREKYWRRFGLNIPWTEKHAERAKTIQAEAASKIPVKTELDNKVEFFMLYHKSKVLEKSIEDSKKSTDPYRKKLEKISDELGAGLHCTPSGQLVECPRSGLSPIPRNRCLAMLKELGYGDPCRK